MGTTSGHVEWAVREIERSFDQVAQMEKSEEVIGSMRYIEPLSGKFWWIECMIRKR